MRVWPSGWTGHMCGGVDAMIVINGEDADEARPVAAAAAADVAAVAVLLDARLSALAAR